MLQLKQGAMRLACDGGLASWWWWWEEDQRPQTALLKSGQEQQLEVETRIGVSPSYATAFAQQVFASEGRRSDCLETLTVFASGRLSGFAFCSITGFSL